MADVVAIDSGDIPKDKTPSQWAKYWTREMTAYEKRIRRFQKQGNSIVDRYLDKRNGGGDDSWFSGAYGVSTPTSRLNLFHMNVSTTCAMLYGNVPKVDVAREHNDPDDDVARVAAMLFQRLLQADIECSGESFSTALKAALLDRLLPGMGVARVRYEFTASKVKSINPETLEVEDVDQVEVEKAPIEYIHWQDFAYGWCRTWAECPWIGFRSWLTKQEATKRFGAKIAEELTYANQEPTGDKDGDVMNVDQSSTVQKAAVWEIWCKKEKRVFWWSTGVDLILDAIDDPYGLEGFWPCPMPMMANTSTSLFIAQADFITAQDLYNEIDILQSRIANITRAIKVVGVYDKSATDSVGRMLKEGVENDMIPVDNWAMFAEKGGLKGVVDWFPVETVVNTLQVLSQIQENKIQQLNDLTGLSEIMRGQAGGQYTAAASNQMAAKMGSIRIQALQEDFARFASDLESLKVQIVSKHFDDTSIIRQSAAQFIPEADKDKIPKALTLMKSEDIKWRVDIRPESIAMIDYAQLKAERTEFLMAMAQYIQSAQAAAKEMPGSLPVLLELMKWGMSGFKGSTYLEGIMDRAIEMASQPQPQGGDQGPSPEQMKLEVEKLKQQTEQMKSQADLQKIQAKAQADLQTAQAKLQGEIQKIQVDAQRDMTLEQQQQQNKLMEIARELEADIAQIRASMESSVEIEMTQADADIALERIRHENNMREIAAQNRGRMP